MITIVDSGGANIASIQFALARLGKSVQLSCDPRIIQNSSHVILPGVGTAKTSMQRLQSHQLTDVIQSLTQPVLGICLGMQLLFDFSEEGNVACLQCIPGIVKKMSTKPGFSIPHMGWNTVVICKSNLLLKNITDPAYLYFVHGYAISPSESTIAITRHSETVSAAVQYNNFFGTQFHPERSSTIGLSILANFLEL